MKKKILYTLLAGLIIMQFFRSDRNVSEIPSENDIRVHYSVPADVMSILKRACYDCHSNNTNYPWYANIQPVGWWLQGHIDHGKGELNFSEFGGYKAKRARHKLEEIAELVEKKIMPMESYTIIHKDAILSDSEIETLVNWASSLRKTIQE